MNKKILVSGIKPTGDFHFGNYFGAMRQNIELSNSGEYDSFVFLADYHALTTLHNFEDAQKLAEYTLRSAAAYIACGLDKNLLFKQSSVPEHAELSLIFSNLVTMPYMMRAHAFKDHEAKNKDVNVGLFTYPILMAADILIYGADVVPVGKDQKQHIEYARDIAGYFNSAYSAYVGNTEIVEYLKLPKELIIDAVGTVPGVDGRKMSKSYLNQIDLFCEEEDLKKKIMSIVTDSATANDKKDPDVNNVFNIHKHFLNKDQVIELKNKFENGGYSYKDAKQDLLNTILDWRKDKKDIYDKLLQDRYALENILEKNGERVREVAQKKIKEIREIIGLDSNKSPH